MVVMIIGEGVNLFLLGTQSIPSFNPHPSYYFDTLRPLLATKHWVKSHEFAKFKGHVNAPALGKYGK